MRLNDYLDFWLEKVIRQSVRPATYVTYYGFIANHIKPQLGDRELADITLENIQKLVNALSIEKKLSPKTVRLIISMLSSGLRCAVDYGYIIKNPCAGVRLPAVIEKAVSALERSEQSKIESAILKQGDKRHLGILICLYTGIRLGELCGLKWKDINFNKRSLSIGRSLIRLRDISSGTTILSLEPPKTAKSTRVIPLPTFLCDLLREYREESNSPFVLSMKSGKSVEPRTMQNLYRRFLKSAGVKYSNFHALRHTFATRALELSADIKSVSEILGHTNTSITINRYAHSLYEQKRKTMLKFNLYFNKRAARKQARR